MKWKDVNNLPGYTGFVWVQLSDGSVHLAYHVQAAAGCSRFKTAYSAGDMEGLRTEYYTNVEFWMDLEEPKQKGVAWTGQRAVNDMLKGLK